LGIPWNGEACAGIVVSTLSFQHCLLNTVTSKLPSQHLNTVISTFLSQNFHLINSQDASWIRTTCVMASAEADTFSLHKTFWLICGAAVQALLRVLSHGKVENMTVKLAQPARLIPVHTKGRPPSYFIIAGLLFGQVRHLCTPALIFHRWIPFGQVRHRCIDNSHLSSFAGLGCG